MTKLDANKIDAKLKNYAKLVLEPEQKLIVSDVVQVLQHAIDLNQIILTGLCWEAIREWQIRHERLASELSKSDFADRVGSVGEMLQIVKSKLEKLLTKEEDKGWLEDCINEALEHYKNTYARRMGFEY